MTLVTLAHHFLVRLWVQLQRLTAELRTLRLSALVNPNSFGWALNHLLRE